MAETLQKMAPMRLSEAVALDNVDEPQGMRLGDVVSMDRVDLGSGSIFQATPEQQAEWAGRGPIGFFEQARRQDKTEMIPFNPESAVKSVKLLNAVNRLKKDEYSELTKKEQDISLINTFLEKSEEERVRGFTIGGRVTQGVAVLPGFMVEFLATGGVAALGKKSTIMAAEAAAGQAVKQGALKFATRAVATGAGAVARTAAMPHRVVESYAQRQLDSSLEITPDGLTIAEESYEKPHISFAKAFGDVVIENFSEVTGPVLSQAASRIIPAKMSQAMTGLWQRLHPDQSINQLFTRLGYHGFLEELGEERVSALLKAVTGVDDFGAKDPDNMFDRIVASVPDGEQLLVESGVLAFPGATNVAAQETIKILRGRQGSAKAPKVDPQEVPPEVLDSIAAMQPAEEKGGEANAQPGANPQGKVGIDFVRAALETENKGRDISPEEKVAQDFIFNNFDQARQNYIDRSKEEFAADNVVSADIGKFAIPGMNAVMSGAYHEPGSALSKLREQELLANPATKDLPVGFMAGGSGAGKSNILRSTVAGGGIQDKFALVHDTNLNHYGSAKKKIERALESGRNVEIVYVYRDPLDAYKNGVIPRVKTQDRIVPISEHIKTHRDSLPTVKRISDEYKGDPRVNIILVNNSFGKGNWQDLPGVDSVPQFDYTGIEDKLYAILTEALQKGQINEAQFKTALKGSPKLESLAKEQGLLDNVPGPEGRGGAPKEGQAASGLTPSKDILAERAARGGKLTKEEAQEFPDLGSISQQINEIDAQIDTAQPQEKDSLQKRRDALIEQLGFEPGQNIRSSSPLKKVIREKTGQTKEDEKTVSERDALLAVLKGQVAAAKQSRKATREEIFDIQSNLIQFLKDSDLEAKDKAKFIAAIKNIQTNEEFEKELPEIERRIADLEQKAEKRSLIEGIKKQVKDAESSNKIAIDYVNAIRETVEQIDLQKRRPETIAALKATKEFIQAQLKAGEEVDVPTDVLKRLDLLNKKKIENITIEDLRDLSEQIDRLVQLGETKLRARQSVEAAKVQKDLEDIGKDSKPLNKIQLTKAPIGERLTAFEDLKNKLNNAINVAQAADISLTPMDVIFDTLDAVKNYKGANYRVFKKTTDEAYSRYLDKIRKLTDRVVDMANEFNFDDANFERIGFYAAAQQENGPEKLIAMGHNEEIVNNFKLEGDELKLYNAMRDVLDNLRPEIAEVMRVVYNENLGKVKNYFPFMTDFEAMSDSEIRDRFGDNVEQFGMKPRKNVEKGFTKARLGGDQKLKLNAMEIFLKHVDNAAYLTEVGPVSKRLGEIAASDSYKKAVGEYGQEIVRDWVDLIARKGRTQGDRSIVFDWLRKNTGIATLGFKLSSLLVQPTALMDGAALIGPDVFQGVTDITNRDWRTFLRDNFPELRERGADDPAYLEFGDSALDKLGKAGFYPLQKMDLLTASSVAAGAYRKALKDQGLELDLKNPNKEALTEAQRLLRRTQSSAFFKDVPSAISRGKLTGNISVDKAILQFQSFMLNRWSLIRHDMYRAGILGENKQQAINIAVWLTLANLAEIGIRRLSKEIIAALTGDELDDWDETFKDEVVRGFLGNIPFLSTMIGFGKYASVPIPSVDMVRNIAERFEALNRSKKKSTKERNALRAWTMLIGFLFRIPGTVQADDLIKKMMAESERK